MDFKIISDIGALLLKRIMKTTVLWKPRTERSVHNSRSVEMHLYRSENDFAMDF